MPLKPRMNEVSWYSSERSRRRKELTHTSCQMPLSGQKLHRYSERASGSLEQRKSVRSHGSIPCSTSARTLLHGRVFQVTRCVEVRLERVSLTEEAGSSEPLTCALRSGITPRTTPVATCLIWLGMSASTAPAMAEASTESIIASICAATRGPEGV